MRKQAFFVGIKGVGMSSLAVLFKQAGFTVVGSDVDKEFITDSVLLKEGIEILKGFDEKVIEDLDSQTLIVYTGAHGGITNPQVKKALDKGLDCKTYGEVLGLVMDQEIIPTKQIGISVAGSHGKTTISAMVATYLSKLGMDPSYIVGTSDIFPLGAAGHFGKGNYFVAEADEYLNDPVNDRTPKFLLQHPQYAILNNIDFDHPDAFSSMGDIEQAFKTFVEGMKPNAVVIINGDDLRLQNLKKSLSDSVTFITVGADNSNDYYLDRFHESGFNSFFSVQSKDFSLGEFSLSVPGYHNAKNVVAVIALLVELGVPAQKVQEVLPSFLGTKRRLEHVGVTENGADVLDDYAHHPEEIKASLKAIKDAYPEKQVLCIFQPHTVSRTRALLSEFTTAFRSADDVILLPVFASAREVADDTIETEMKIKFQEVQKKVLFLKTSDDVLAYIKEHVKRPDTVVVTMGAGDVYKIGEELIKQRHE